MQESNSFALRSAEIQDFTIHSGEDIRAAYDGTESEITGFLDSCAEYRWEPVLLTTATATSGGPLSASCFEELLTQLVRAVAAQPLDGLLLALHGAMSTEAYLSGDAECARRVRAAIGPEMPFAVSLDFHANLHADLLRQVDGVSGYRTYPHIDQRETGRRAAAILACVIDGERPVHWRLPIPMLLPAESSSTFDGPLHPVMEQLSRDFGSGCNASLFCVQPWLDFDPVGGSLVVTEFGHNDVAPKMEEIARHLWAIRRDFRVDWVQPEELIGRIDGAQSRPVLVSEAYDSPSAGAGGNNPALIEVLLPHAERLKCCAVVVDPDLVAVARAAGMGSSVERTIGGLAIRARVENLTDGSFFPASPSAHAKRFSMGPAAVLATGRMRIVVASKPVMLTDPEVYRSQGIEPAELDVVGVKSALQFRTAYASISRTVIHLDMPGPARGRLEAVPFQKISRPIFPLDDFDWMPPAPTRVVPRSR